MSQGGGKVGGLTRPGSKIPVADSASARSSRPAAKSKSSVDDVDVSKCGQALVGRQVRKLFGRNGYFDGEITHYVPDQEVYRVKYCDGEMERLGLKELRPILVATSTHGASAPHSSSSKDKDTEDEDENSLNKKGRTPKAAAEIKSESKEDNNSESEQEGKQGKQLRRGKPSKSTKLAPTEDKMQVCIDDEQSENEQPTSSPKQTTQTTSKTAGSAASATNDAVQAKIVGQNDTQCSNGCEGDDAQATHYCRDCDKVICNFCVRAHSRQPKFKLHVLSEISQAVATAAPTTSAVCVIDDDDDEEEAKPKEVQETAQVEKKVEELSGSKAVGQDETEDEEEDEEVGADGSNEYCEVCGGSGELVCCDFCPCAYHGLKCLGSKAEDLPDPYKCPKCTGDLQTAKAAYRQRKNEKKLAKEQKRSKPRTSSRNAASDDDEMQDANDDEEDGENEDADDVDVDADDEDDDEDDDSGDDIANHDGPRRGQRLTRGMAAKTGEEVGSKKGNSRLQQQSDTESSSAAVSDSSEEDAKDAVEEEDGESPSKGPKRKQIRKVKSLNKLILQAAEEGQDRDAKRQVAKDKAQKELGAPLILKVPGKEGEEEQEVVVPEHMSAQLQPHQRVGVSFIWDCLINQEKGAILAHCMGLGKTFQSITVLQCLWQHGQITDDKHTILVLAPVNVIRNWEAEMDKWLPEPDSKLAPPVFTMVEAGALHADRADYLDEWTEEGGIMLMGYEQFRNLSSGRGLRKGKKHAGIKERYHKALLDPGPHMVVCDEGHILRREKSGVTQAVRGMRTMRRVVLSGTPLQNNLMEYHCMVDFVRPGTLGDGAGFKRDFVAPILNGQCIDSTPSDVKQMRHRSHILNHVLKSCVDRADFKVLQPYLKPKYEFIIGMRLSALQVEMYKCVLQENVPQLTSDGRGVGKIVGVRVIGTYHKLAKIWTHPRITIMQKAKAYDSMDEFVASDSEECSWSEEDERQKKMARKKAKKSADGNVDGVDSDDGKVGEWLDQYKDQLEDMAADAMGKMLFLNKLLKEAGLVGDKVLLFSQSLLVLDLIEDMLRKAKKRGDALIDSKGRSRSWQQGTDYFRLDGSTSGDKRKKEIDKFNGSKKARLYLISTRAGSLGVNLVSANRVVIMDASWNPSYDTQAIFRAYRFGQEKVCYVYRLLAHGTMEEKIYGRQVTKQALASRVVDAEETGRHFSSEELGALFDFSPGPTAEQVAAEQSALTGAKSHDLTREAQASEYLLDKGQSDAATSQAAISISCDAAIGISSQSATEPGTAPAPPAAPQAPPAVKQEATAKKEWGGKEEKERTNLFAATCLPPKDDVLARVLGQMMPQWIVGYHEADDVNEVETELSAEEVAIAWKEWEAKNKQPEQPVPQYLRVRDGVGSDGKPLEKLIPLSSTQGLAMLKDHQRTLIVQGWVQYHNDSGRPYYNNPKTQQTVWELPMWPGTVAGGYGFRADEVPMLREHLRSAELQQHRQQQQQMLMMQQQQQMQMLYQQRQRQGGASADAPLPAPAGSASANTVTQQQLLQAARLSAPATALPVPKA